MGLATSRMRPKWGCSTSRTISRARTCSSSRAWATLFTGAHGTWPRRRPSHSAVVFSAKRTLRRSTSSALWAKRSAKPTKRGSWPSPGPGGPEAAEGAADDARILVLELGVGEPGRGGQIAPHVVEDGVGDLHGIVEDGAGRRVLEIEGERLLAAIERLEVERVLLVQ